MKRKALPIIVAALFALSATLFVVAFAPYLLALSRGGVEPTTQAAITAMEEPSPPPDLAYAYFLIAENLFEEADRADLDYLAADLDNVKFADTVRLVELLRQYCDDRGATLLLNDFYGLRDKGYISDRGSFMKDGKAGVLIFFGNRDPSAPSGIELNSNTLVAEASFFRAGLFGAGNGYTVEYTSNGWEITNVKPLWIS